jgi:cysteinyl-tRNA synthetase
MIKLHNTLTNSTDQFKPINEGIVTLYTCGPTVYSEPLVGNWVAYIRWDLLVRVLYANSYKVKRVMNITDVGHLVSDADEGEDKIAKGAKREGITEWEVAERYTNKFLEGMTQLNLQPPEYLVKATEHIEMQIELIKSLEDKGYTYVISDGVYFDTSKFPNYASFAHLDLEAQRAGARVSFNTEKRHGSDFVLWRLIPNDEDRAMQWDSPWGKGFPGWHIECSAMGLYYLGETIDIHTGGIDHIPVHHTNEIAQSEAVTGKPFANYWLHSNFLQVDGTKISKSLSNGHTLSEINEHGFTPLDFKMFVLQSHYRSESNFTWDNLAAASNRLGRWKAVAAIRHQVGMYHGEPIAKDINANMNTAKQAILDNLNQDLNSPLALTEIDHVFDSVERAPHSSINSVTLTELLAFIDDCLGLELLPNTPDITDDQKQMIGEREEARKSHNWKRSDELRNELAALKIGLSDTGENTRWFYL